MKKFNHSKLFVGKLQYAYVAMRRQVPLGTLDMNLGIFTAYTVADVDRVLEHSKTIGFQTLSEEGVVSSVFLGFRWQVKKHKYPHDSVLIKAF